MYIRQLYKYLFVNCARLYSNQLQKLGMNITILRKNMNKTSKLTMLGTGSALVTKCYNTCFTIQTPQTLLLVDAGGGNGILAQLEKADIKLGDVHHIFITHAHTDHIIGVLWVVRVFIQYALRGMADGQLHLYGHDKSLLVLRSMIELMLPAKLQKQIGTIVLLHEIKDGDSLTIEDLQLTCFDILSTKEKQFGFRAILPDGQHLCCLGDEPYNPVNKQFANGADWLLAESFCLYDHRDIFKPYEKSHVTVKDAAEQAETLGVKNLVIYHTEDKNIDRRKELYTAEAKTYYNGNVYVPEDLETITLEHCDSNGLCPQL